MFFHVIICLLKEWLNEKNMPRCNNELSINCYVKDKGINTLSYLELIIKKINSIKNIKKLNHVTVLNVVM